MKKNLFIAMLLISTAAISEELTRDESDACAALLCLSSAVGGSVSECTPPLTRYYSITARKTYDTIKKRKDFLNICPSVEGETGMSELVDAVSQGAGRCDAAQLNKELMQTRREFLNCKSYVQSDVDCTVEIQQRISNKLPSYCEVYINNAYTDIGLHYSGSPIWQSLEDSSKSTTGKWID